MTTDRADRSRSLAENPQAYLSRASMRMMAAGPPAEDAAPTSGRYASPLTRLVWLLGRQAAKEIRHGSKTRS